MAQQYSPKSFLRNAPNVLLQRYLAEKGICPDMACERIRQELEKRASKTAAFQVVAEELGVPVPTVKTWHRRIHLNPGKAPKRPGKYYQTCAVSDLQTLIGAGKKFGCIYADPPGARAAA